MAKVDRKLSHSACCKYLSCPFSYDAYYNKGIQPVKKGSALVFGIGIDAGLNALLLNNAEAIDEYYKAVSAIPLGNMIPGQYDYDHELLNENQKINLLKQLREFGYQGDNIDSLAETLLRRIKDGEVLSDNQYCAIDLLARACLEVKAELMFQAYERLVLPQIEEVISVQSWSGSGILDAKVRWKGLGVRILDNKTSSRAYPQNAIEYSAQLAMYAAEEKITDVTYVVLIKQLKKNREKRCQSCGHIGKGSHSTCDNIVNGKRCKGEWIVTISPEAEIQIVHGEIIDKALEVAAETEREIKRAIKAEIFPCNLPKCNDQYGKPCEYRDLKWKGSMEGLEIRKRSRK